jgi:DNA-binding MarR family transcriptional regulator
MTDINRTQARRPAVVEPVSAPAVQAAIDPADREHLLACVELLFFAYRDFTGDPDAVLEQYGFGRAHHRVLHFVQRNPGLRVAQLLDILKITKQSLSRVLKQLLDEGYISQKTGPEDRRERLLFTTIKGTRLAEKLAGLQLQRVAAALDGAGPDAASAARRFLLGMIGENDRAQVEALILSSRLTASGPEARRS